MRYFIKSGPNFTICNDTFASLVFVGLVLQVLITTFKRSLIKVNAGY